MKQKDYIIFYINFIDSTIEAADKLIDFYINHSKYDNELSNSINNLLTGYSILLPMLPQVLTGRLDGKNLKQELILTLHELQLDLFYSDESSDNLRLSWSNFLNFWKYYKKIVIEMANSDKFVNICTN
ncbi:hypothetical protein MASR1M45_00080 [Candidatus Kapaibacterium sp.]